MSLSSALFVGTYHGLHNSCTRADGRFEQIVGNSSALEMALAEVERVAPTDSTVLILGETGTGKELIARTIHNASRRRERLWLANCYFGHDSSEFPVLLPFFDAPSGGSFHPFRCYPSPPARTWRCPLYRC